MQLSVQGYLQQRKRLNPEIFPYLNRKYLMDFYRSDEDIRDKTRYSRHIKTVMFLQRSGNH